MIVTIWNGPEHGRWSPPYDSFLVQDAQICECFKDPSINVLKTRLDWNSVYWQLLGNANSGTVYLDKETPSRVIPRNYLQLVGDSENILWICNFMWIQNTENSYEIWFKICILCLDIIKYHNSETLVSDGFVDLLTFARSTPESKYESDKI